MKNFKKYYKIKTEIEDVYACLTNPVTIELWSGYPAKMTTDEGSEFELWDGDISGKILRLSPNKEIIQQWYFGEQIEPSIVTIKLHHQKNYVSVELEHTNIPEEVFEEFSDGWTANFFDAIKNFLEE